MMLLKGRKPEEPSDVVNEELYSRQLYVLGAAAQRRLQKSRVLVSGELSGLGAELCKNVVLAGVNSLCLHDDSPCDSSDQASAGFLYNDAHVSKAAPRAFAALEELREMNANVSVVRVEGEPDYRTYDVVVLVNATKDRVLNISSLLRADDAPRKTRLIVCGMYGLFSYTFSDFGDVWEVSDADGEVVKSGLILTATAVPNKPGELEVITELPHGLSEGDLVKFTSASFNDAEHHHVVTGFNLAEPRQIHLVTVPQSKSKVEECKFRIDIGVSSAAAAIGIAACLDGCYFEQVKQALTITTHEPFAKSLETHKFVNNSFEDETKPDRLFGLLEGIWAFQEAHQGRLPESAKLTDADFVLHVAERKLTLSKEQREELRLLACTSGGKLSPVASFMGGVAGQEVLKACTGKFLPLEQWLMFASTECLTAANLAPARLCTPSKFAISRYQGQARVFGVDGQKKLGALKVFVVGAGALGCEILKNLALMGVSTKSEGGVTYVTDPDSIEMSNLNRQFLFRPASVGKNKAVTAAAAARKMNPDMQIVAYQDRVCTETTATVFNDAFWDSLDLVINALDNVPSRMFVDTQCVYYGKPLFESGTLGTKANTLPVIPNLTESYGSDPVKDFDSTPEIPACTLHAYPNLFEHCLQWARDAVFERDFALEPNEAKSFLDSFRQGARREANEGDDGDYVQTLLRQPNSINQKIRTARAVIVGIQPTDHPEGLFPYFVPTHGQLATGASSARAPSSPMMSPVKPSKSTQQQFAFKECVSLARLKFQELFSNKIDLLLAQHPAGSKDGEVPFWSGKRRLPSAAKFNEEDQAHLLFVSACAKLFARVHGVTSADDVKSALATGPAIPPFRSPASATSLVAAEQEESPSSSSWRSDLQLMQAAATAKPSLQIEPLRFDKDDDLHVDLVWSAAVIRARNYKIPPLDRMEAKRVVGRIIPAIATSTAAATGLVALELYKYVLADVRKLEHYRACNFNLAVNAYASFEPRPCTTCGGNNLWTVITLRGNLTVEDLIARIEREFNGFQVSSVTTTGEVTLYNDLFSMEDEKMIPIVDLYRKVVGKEPPHTFIPLNVDGDFEDDEEDEEEDENGFVVPPIRLRWAEGAGVGEDINGDED